MYLEDSQNGAVLGMLRRSLGLTQFELSKILQVAPETVRSWEAGRGMLPEKHVKALLALILDIKRLAFETVSAQDGPTLEILMCSTANERFLPGKLKAKVKQFHHLKYILVIVQSLFIGACCKISPIALYGWTHLDMTGGNKAKNTRWHDIQGAPKDGRPITLVLKRISNNQTFTVRAWWCKSQARWHQNYHGRVLQVEFENIKAVAWSARE